MKFEFPQGKPAVALALWFWLSLLIYQCQRTDFSHSEGQLEGHAPAECIPSERGQNGPLLTNNPIRADTTASPAGPYAESTCKSVCFHRMGGGSPMRFREAGRGGSSWAAPTSQD